MTQLMPIFRVMPAVLVAYGLALTIANIVELRATASVAGMESSFHSPMRLTYLAGLVRSFSDLFYYWGFAAIVAAANRYLEAKA